MENFESEVFERILDPLGDCLNDEAAQRIIALRADEAVQARVDELAQLANEGQLSERERIEYAACRSAFHFITILQAKARTFLAEHRRS